nr:MAG TPA: hypothetical protein [Caudoviricetes sp.]
MYIYRSIKEGTPCKISRHVKSTSSPADFRGIFHHFSVNFHFLFNVTY